MNQDFFRARAATRLLTALSLTALSACNQTMPVLPAGILQLAGASAADLQGNWSGSYLCGQGRTAVRLALQAAGPQELVGRFDFGNLPGQSNVSPGAFTVKGIVRQDRLELAPDAWLVRPINYNAVRVLANLQRNPDRLVGRVTDNGCGAFEVLRDVAATPASPTPFAAPDRPFAPGATGSAAVLQSAAPTAPVGATARSAATAGTSSARGMNFTTFLSRLGEKNRSIQRLSGTKLDLQLKRGSIAGTSGFVQDPQVLVLFRCPAGSRFGGGPLSAKITRLRENDEGLFVDLDRCDR